MKTFLKEIIGFTIIMAIPKVGYAYDFEIDGIYYNINVSDRTASVTSGNNKYKGDIIIPSSVFYANQELPVVAIGNGAFSYCSSLVSIEIPNSVTSIRDDAFYNCSSLVSIEIPNSVTSIGDEAFSRCSSLVSIEIPNSVTSIGTSAFDGCSSLKKLFFEDGETKLSLISNPNHFKDSPIEELYLGRNLDYPSGNYRFSPFYENTGFKTISLGNYVTDAKSIYPQKIESLEVINCYNPEPPLMQSFTNVQYANVIVNIPKGSLKAYQENNLWGNFWNLIEVDWKAGIETIELDSQLYIRTEGNSIILDNWNNNKLINIYNLNGQCLYSGYDSIISNLPKGLIMIKIGNQSKKILIP